MTETQATQTKSPFHAGEERIQDTLGVTERMAAFGSKIVRDFMPDQHRDFYAQLPFVILGSVDAAGDPWATILTGQPGFMRSSDSKTLHIGARPQEEDPAAEGVSQGAAVGILGIEPPTRRRNRLNGTLANVTPEGFDLRVEHSFGNCPQYIFTRVSTPDARTLNPPKARTATTLSDADKALIARADTFYVASYVDPVHAALSGEQRQVDVSHRGGKPGFVRIGADGLLTIPDFAGNLHFNTLGNLLLNPRAGLLFIDFGTGDLLQITGETKVILEGQEIAAFQGAERLWTVRPRKIVRRPQALGLRFSFGEASPNSLLTGSWDDAATRLEAERLRKTWRPYRIARKIRESAAVTSIHLEPADGGALIPHQAGQYLPIRVSLPGTDDPVPRTYTIAAAPSDGMIRISVKRDGRVSTALHDALKVGDRIEARGPAGRFTIDAAQQRPVVMLAAGIGITPILAMLRHLVFERARTRTMRRTWLFYAARTLAERAFDAEIAELVDKAGGALTVVRALSAPEETAQPGRDFEVHGRLGVHDLKAHLPFDDYDFYLCGPEAFTQERYDELRAMSVPDARIFAESFGPSSLLRRPDATAGAVAPAAPATQAATRDRRVVFSRSGKEARWEPGTDTLLELAEAHGLSPEYSCRSGSCGSCLTKVLKGRASHLRTPGVTLAADEALICSAVPAEAEVGDDEPLVLDL